MVTDSNSPKRVEKEPVCETNDIDTRAAIIKPTEYFAIFDKMVSLFGAVGDLVLAIRLIGSQN